MIVNEFPPSIAASIPVKFLLEIAGVVLAKPTFDSIMVGNRESARKFKQIDKSRMHQILRTAFRYNVEDMNIFTITHLILLCYVPFGNCGSLKKLFTYVVVSSPSW